MDGLEKACVVLVAAAALDGRIDEVELEVARTFVFRYGKTDESLAAARSSLESLSAIESVPAVIGAVYGCKESLSRDELRDLYDNIFTMIMSDGTVTDEEKIFYRLLTDLWSISRA